MFNQVLLSIGRKLSAHLFTTCIFCILILIVLIGGLIQVISSVAFSAYLDNSNDQQQQEMTISPTPPFSVLTFDGSSVVDQMYEATRHSNNNSNSKNATTSYGKGGAATNSIGDTKSSGNHASFVSSSKNDHDDKMTNGFLSTKILYKPYTVTNSNSNNNNEQYNKLDKELLNKSPSSSSSSSGIGGSGTSSNSKSKTINLTVTPSITDRVIADLKNMKKEEYLAQQRVKETVDSDENYEAIYIDGDDDGDDVVDFNVRNLTNADVQSTIEKMPSSVAEITDDDVRAKAKSKSKTKPKSKSRPNTGGGGGQMIGVRDKKASKKPIIITQKYKSFDETLDITDDDDDDYDTNMSGSGDFNSQRETDPDWIAPLSSIEQLKTKQLNKQERIIKDFAENAYGDEVVDIITENANDGIDFFDKDNDDQVISQKIAKATQRKQQQQKQPKPENAGQNQMFKPKLRSKLKSKQPMNNRQKANNKRKSKEQQYIEEYFSGTKTNSNGNSDSSAGTEAELIKV